MLLRGVPVLEDALDRIVHLERCSRGLNAALAQIPVAIFLFLDANFGIWSSGTSAWVAALETALGALLLSKGIYNAFSYLAPTFRMEQIPLTEEQMKRLGVKPQSPGFKKVTANQNSKARSPTFSPLEGSFILKGGLTGSPNLSVSSSSWIFNSPSVTPYHSSRPFISQEVSSEPKREENLGKRRPMDFKRSHFTETSHNNSSLTDEKSLNEFLKEFEAWEKSHSFVSSPSNEGNNTGSSFWKPSATTSPVGNSGGLDYSPILKKYSYQLATQQTTSSCSGNCSSPVNTNIHHSDSCDLLSVGGVVVGGGGTQGIPHSPSSTILHKEMTSVSLQLGVDPLRVVQMTQNLRMWITQTVLARIVKEIDSTNKALGRLGLSDCKIGEFGLEKIKKNSQFHLNSIPSLSSLIPFLEVSMNQEYLINRLRELCSGGAMGSFRWNGGGRYKGMEWNDKLVSDAEIVMHCLACYFDSRLPPNYDYIEGDGRAFSSVFYFKSPEKPDLKKMSSSAAIVQSSLKPPYYYLQFKDKLSEVEPGRNNLFHIILLFLHHIKTKEDGMVGRINFGPSGVNIHWVLER